MTTRVVVTGGAGFIGSHVVDRLRAEGADVLVVDNLSSGRIENLDPSVAVERAHVATGKTGSLIRRWQPDSVVHCAAQVSVAASVRDPRVDATTNIIGSITTIQAAVAAGASRFIYVTTGGALYGEPQYLPCDEDHPIAPLSPYGLSKWVAERYLELLAPPGLIRVVLRLANVYGPRQRSEGEAGVVSIFADRMRRGLPAEIHGDGEQTRDFVFVADVADAVMRALVTDGSLTANVGTGRATSIIGLFRALAAIADYDQEPRHVDPRPGDVRASVLSVALAERELGWAPATTLEIGLAATYHALAGAQPQPRE